MGNEFILTEKMKSDIEKAGFQGVQEYVLKAPLGRWPADPRLKDIGRWCELSFNTGLEGWAMQVLTKYLDVRRLLPSAAYQTNHATVETK
jgi:hypothetical protein